MMKDLIYSVLKDMVEHDEGNRVEDTATGRMVPMVDIPLIGYADAGDDIFRQMQNDDYIGAHYKLPREFMESAQTVISFFFPISEEVRKSNRAPGDPSDLWMTCGGSRGAFFRKVLTRLTEELEKAGVHVVVPAYSGMVQSVSATPNDDPLWAGKTFTTNWSERHTAFACGLGTFGLAGGLITEKGIAGVPISMIVDCALEPTPRNYTEPFEYCIRCGACMKRCPGGAISLDRPMDSQRCLDHARTVHAKYAPKGGCAKCQTAVPCEFKRPAAK